MEISDGPIIMDKSCMNCVHSVERRGGIACGDRGWFLRLFLGLRQIQHPHVEWCNNFVRIPSNVEKICKYCKHFGPYHEWTACWNEDALTLLLAKPYFRAATDTCSDFELAQRYKQRNCKSR